LSASSTDQLPRREREILDILFAVGGNASVEDVRERLVDPPSYSAVRALLGRLQRRGFVRFKEDGPRYLYSPTPSRNTVQRTAVRKLVRTFFGGSRTEAATALVRHEDWSDEELNALSAEIERARRKR
jgi:predicted transcriptional regulator